MESKIKVVNVLENSLHPGKYREPTRKMIVKTKFRGNV